MARYSIRSVTLSPPTSNEQPLGWGWEPPCSVSLAHWCASWMWGVSPTTAQRTSLTPPLAEECCQSWLQGVSWALDRSAVKCMTLHLWAANLKAFFVAHCCIAFTACCKCLSMVSRERPQKQTARSSTNSALKMSLAIHKGNSLIFSPKMSQRGHHKLGHLPLGRIHPRVWSQFLFWFYGPWDIMTQTQAVSLWGQSCESLEWRHIARLFHRPFPSQRRDQLPAVSVQRHPGDIFEDSPGGRSCYDAFWNHIGFCQVSCIFQDTRWNGYWLCAPGLCIDSWSEQWVSNWVGQYGPYWVWELGSPLLLSTVEESL